MSKRKATTAEEFFAADDMRMEWYPLPEAYGEGAGVYVRVMSAEDRSQLEGRFGDEDTVTAEFRKAVIAATVCNEDGGLLFDEDSIDKVMQKNATTIFDLFDRACKVNAFGGRDVEELEKN